MKIAQLAPIWESVPPDKYGGTELVVYNLTEELVARGHEVTLFASGDSRTSAELVPTVAKALYRAGVPWTNLTYPLLHTIELLDRAQEFDVIHVHLNTSQDYFTLAMMEYLELPVVTTIHMELPVVDERADERQILLRFRRNPYITISNAQRTIPDLNYIATIHNGIAVENFRFREHPDDYLVWLGRFCLEKGPREAIEAARKANRRLIMAGKLDWANEPSLTYFEEYIRPEIDGKQIIYLGEVDHQTKVELLGGAIALLNPLRWNEPFGLVTVESLATGTPVVALDKGPIREQVIHGQTGFVVNTVEQMAQAIGWIDNIDRRLCRRHAEEHFSARGMALRYERAYRAQLMSRRQLKALAGIDLNPISPTEPPIVRNGASLRRRIGHRSTGTATMPESSASPRGRYSSCPDLSDQTGDVGIG